MKFKDLTKKGINIAHLCRNIGVSRQFFRYAVEHPKHRVKILKRTRTALKRLTIEISALITKIDAELKKSQ